jgi:hypothetical protein
MLGISGRLWCRWAALAPPPACSSPAPAAQPWQVALSTGGGERGCLGETMVGMTSEKPEE